MALKWLRDQFKHLKIVLWAVVAVFILLVFVDWGSGRSGRRATGDVAIRVGDRVVSEAQFLREVKRNNDEFQARLGDQWETFKDSFHLGAYTTQQLIQRQLMLLEAERLGLLVSREELQEKVQSYPVFQREGGGFVGKDLYRRILRANRMTAQQFEAGLEEDLLVAKLSRMVQDGVWVSDAEVETRLRRDRESCDLSFVQVSAAAQLDQVEVSEDELAAYYAASAEEYRRPEQRSIRYLVVETSRLQRLLPVEDSELEAYLAEHQEEYTLPEQMNARHVLIRTDPAAGDAARAEAELVAHEVATKARAGEPFEQLAAEYSDDPASRDNGGDVGWFSRGSLVPEFEQAVFGAAEGDIVGPVKSQYGYHVIQVGGRRAARAQTLDEVREKVRFRVLEGRAAAAAESRAADLMARLEAEPGLGEDGWQKLADEDESVVLNLSPAFARDEVIPGIGQDSGLAEAVFAADAGAIGGPHPVPRGWMVWQLREITPEGVPPLEDVRSAVEQAVRQEKAEGRARDAAEELATRWREGSNVEELVATLQTEVTPVDGHRRGGKLAEVAQSAAFDDVVFSAAVGDVVGPVEVGDGTFAVARVESMVRVDAAQIATEGESVRATIRGEKASELLGSMLGELRREVEIVTNDELVERFAPRAQG